MHSRSAAPTSLLDLVHRRAALLGEQPSDELDAVTRELTDRLASEAPLVRRVQLSETGDAAALLGALISSEPVHPFDPDDPRRDLADRLAEDRRCFVLEHPALPGHPMNVVWVALWKGVPGRIADILDPDAATTDPRTADTAVFYSIWNVEPGLVGIPGGTSLLSGAIDLLRAEFPDLAEFVTLSPIPGFREWGTAHSLDVGPPVADPPALLHACATYLTALGDDGRLLDAVARFHMGNGARLVHVAADADPSERGMRRSWGLMANYRYEPEDRAANRESLRSGRPATSEEVEQLLRGDSLG